MSQIFLRVIFKFYLNSNFKWKLEPLHYIRPCYFYKVFHWDVWCELFHVQLLLFIKGNSFVSLFIGGPLICNSLFSFSSCNAYEPLGQYTVEIEFTIQNQSKGKTLTRSLFTEVRKYCTMFHWTLNLINTPIILCSVVDNNFQLH